MPPETATFDDSLSSAARKAAETWVTAPVAPYSPSVATVCVCVGGWVGGCVRMCVCACACACVSLSCGIYGCYIQTPPSLPPSHTTHSPGIYV
jgi:hypothetical protein